MFCKVCRAAKSKNIFSNEGAGVYIFVVLNAHFPRFVRLKNKKTRKDLLQTWKFKTKKKKIKIKKLKKKCRKKKQEELTQSIQRADKNWNKKTINSYKFLFLILIKNLNTLSFQPTYRDLMKISA